METQKISLANIQGKLNRREMKNIMAGTAVPGCYKCCWDAKPSLCSECSFSFPGAPCASGASLSSCSGC